MKLYALPGTCALAPNIALQWAGADYEVELVERQALTQPAYLAIHALGKVPALVRDDGRVLTEVLAILDWIAEAYPEAALGGQDADERYAINQWLSFLATELHAAARAHDGVVVEWQEKSRAADVNPAGESINT